jgi:type III secretion protein J
MRLTVVQSRFQVWLLMGVLLLAGCKEALYTDLSEVEANRMRSALAAAGIEAVKEPREGGRWTLEVPRDAVGRALQTLETAGLPGPRYGSTLDSMRSDALVPSAGEDRARLVHGLSQELAQTISSLDGVQHARVHLSMPDKPGPGQRSVVPPSASVLVRHQPGHNLAAMNGAIKLLVARSVEGLTPDRVSVITVAAEVPARVRGNDSMATQRVGASVLPSLPALAVVAVVFTALGCALAVAVMKALARRQRSGLKAQAVGATLQRVPKLPMQS